MCTHTQKGYNAYWNQITLPFKYPTFYERDRKCICGRMCHENEVYHEIKTLTITTNTSSYVSHHTLKNSEEWQYPVPNYPQKIVDTKTGVIFNKVGNGTLYENASTGSTYHLTRWRYKLDHKSNKRKTNRKTGGDEIMEKRYVTKKVPKTRTVRNTQKTEGSTHYKWVDNPYDEHKYKNHH